MVNINFLIPAMLVSVVTLTACQESITKNARPEDSFLAQLKPHCGKAYGGEITSQDAADEAWRQEKIIMHVRDCRGGEIKIALHIGENRSRTWILRQEDGGRFALRHDHRHEDGSPDALTFYGGFTADVSNNRISFPADQSTKELFDRENIPVSKDNIWAMEISPSRNIFSYEMRRPNRDFRIEFNLGRAVNLPPTPWGWE